MTEPCKHPASEVKSHYRPTTCAACDARIDPDDRRVSWRVQRTDVVHWFHYCGEACFPECAPTP